MCTDDLILFSDKYFQLDCGKKALLTQGSTGFDPAFQQHKLWICQAAGVLNGTKNGALKPPSREYVLLMFGLCLTHSPQEDTCQIILCHLHQRDSVSHSPRIYGYFIIFPFTVVSSEYPELHVYRMLAKYRVNKYCYYVSIQNVEVK